MALGCHSIIKAVAGVAQLVEQRFRKPQVVGSSPTVSSSLRLLRGLIGFERARLCEYSLPPNDSIRR